MKRVDSYSNYIIVDILGVMLQNSVFIHAKEAALEDPKVG
jgi:hypothetical protein